MSLSFPWRFPISSVFFFRLSHDIGSVGWRRLETQLQWRTRISVDERFQCVQMIAASCQCIDTTALLDFAWRSTTTEVYFRIREFHVEGTAVTVYTGSRFWWFILKGGQERGIRGSVNNASYFIPVFTSRVVNGALACWAKYGYSRTLSPR